MTIGATTFVLCASAVGLLFAGSQYAIIAQTKLEERPEHEETTSLVKGRAGGAVSARAELESLKEIHSAISRGAEAFLRSEYRVVLWFLLAFAALLFSLITWSGAGGAGGAGSGAKAGALTTLCFLCGAATSVLSGYLGMRVAVFANVRTTLNAQRFAGYGAAFNTAFRAGAVMGTALTSLGTAVLTLALSGLVMTAYTRRPQWIALTECIAGFGLGGSAVALFGRVGGGVFTKAADVGADLVGKLVLGIEEDSPRNPAVIADNVGDNVGDVAGMGADLFGSFAESCCAALLVAAQCEALRESESARDALMLPLVLYGVGLVVSVICCVLGTVVFVVKEEAQVERALRAQLVLSTILFIGAAYWAVNAFLPAAFEMEGVALTRVVTQRDVFVCVLCGCVGGLCVGLSTEYFTSQSNPPVRSLVNACKTSAASNVIAGLALGYKSTVIPVCVLAIVVFVSFSRADLYGVAMAAVGMLGNLATALTIDAYGPVCDNAGGIAEMAGLHRDVRRKTDALDAAGNTTAAIGKGFAIGSACLVSLALYGAFVVRVRNAAHAQSLDERVEILQPMTLAFLLIGSMLPYWFSAMTMQSVGDAAMEMVHEVQAQFDANPALLDPQSTARPDYERCVAISTQSALREMVAPGAMVLLAPLLCGVFFGVCGVYGLLTGAMLSAVQLALAMSNAGGAWDNAKKYIESGVDPSVGGKGSDAHKTSVIGDTIGDPLKDTSGPSLNILMKLMAIISLVFADLFFSINHGRGLLNL